MKVDIERSEKRTGLIFKKTYQVVSVQVTFTEEEKQVIKKERLKDYVVLEREPPVDVKGGHPDRFHLFVSTLLRNRPDTYTVENSIAAENYEEELIEKLEMLKRILTRGADTEGGRRTIEL